MKKYIFIALVFFQIFIQFAKADVILGSGVNITNGTIIRLSGLNCNITVIGNYTVDKLEVYSNYFLINASLAAPTYVSLPYSYNPTTKIINITGKSNTATTLIINISDISGIKLYEISQGYLIGSPSWSSTTKLLSAMIDAPSGTNVTTQIYIPSDIYTNDKFYVSTNVSQWGYSWNSTSRILSVWTVAQSVIKLEVSKLPDGSSCLVADECSGNYCVHNICRSTPTYCGDGYCDHSLGEDWQNCWNDCYYLYAPCKFDYSLSCPNELSLKVDEKLNFQVILTNVGSCLLYPSTLSVAGIPLNWLKIEPNESSQLRKNEFFTFNLTISPKEVGNYSLALNIYNPSQSLSITKLNKSCFISLKVAELPVVKKECPTCPEPTQWSECIEGKQKRTNYRCGPETNFICQPYEETKTCEMPALPEEKIMPIYIFRLIIVIIIISLVIVILKLTIKK
jgi:hypothetical protein